MVNGMNSICVGSGKAVTSGWGVEEGNGKTLGVKVAASINGCNVATASVGGMVKVACDWLFGKLQPVNNRLSVSRVKRIICFFISNSLTDLNLIKTNK